MKEARSCSDRGEIVQALDLCVSDVDAQRHVRNALSGTPQRGKVIDQAAALQRHTEQLEHGLLLDDRIAATDPQDMADSDRAHAERREVCRLEQQPKSPHGRAYHDDFTLNGDQGRRGLLKQALVGADRRFQGPLHPRIIVPTPDTLPVGKRLIGWLSRSRGQVRPVSPLPFGHPWRGLLDRCARLGLPVGMFPTERQF